VLDQLTKLSELNRVVVIVGPNGSGKTTLLEAFQNQLHESGQHFGVLSQDDSVFEELCANELFAALDAEAASGFASKLGLTGVELARPLFLLSSGERAKVLLSLAFSNQQLVLLDEPFSHLDTGSKDVLENLIRESEARIVLANHDQERLSEFPRLNLSQRF
jgi:ATPase subunit of ABC transporter with duplicated ATPase domains